MKFSYKSFGFLSLVFSLLLLTQGCEKGQNEKRFSEFENDLSFLKQHTDVVVLTDPESKARVAVIPRMQARVMTSTAGDEKGLSFGWINRQLVASGEHQPHINVFGGEDRFWLGPEGGQFSIFFKKGNPFDLEHWQTPEPIDWGAWELAEKSGDHARFSKHISLTNYSNFHFDLSAIRVIRVLERSKIESDLKISLPPGIKCVGYESENTIKNTGEYRWKKSTGLLSIWILGMFKHSPSTTIVIPFKKGSEADLGPVVNDAYFGKVPPDRLKIDREAGIVYFKGDGRYRSKIGVSPRWAKNIMGSYDSKKNVLTIVKFSLDTTATDYVNSMWEIQEKPYAGDVANSYNDGPAAPGKKPLGPFYELESSSAAAALAPGESLRHVHQTFHFVGTGKGLDEIVKKVLGMNLSTISGVFH